MKLNKKLLTVMLCISMIGGLFTGCSSKTVVPSDETAESINNAVDSVGAKNAENIEISLAFWDVENALSNGENDKVLKDIQDKFNITIKPVNITWDDYSQKIQLWSASGSLPDIFVGDIRTTSTFNTWASQGLLHEIPEDLSAYPNLSEYMNSPMLNTCKVDDKTYAIFRQTFGEQSATARNTSIAYRWDLAQKAGITKEPTNWDEFRAMIQAIIIADPEGNNVQGMTAVGYDRLVGAFLPYSLPLGTVGGTSFYWTEAEDGTYIPAYLAGDTLGADALPALQLMRDMYTEGTIEKDIVLTGKAQSHEKFLNGQSAAILADGFGGAWEDVGAYWKDVHGEDFFDDVKALDLMPDINGNPAYPISDYAWSESYINASVDDEKFDRILQLYDYLLSDEGAFLGTYGYEGETYKFDENGTVELLNDKAPNETYPSTDLFSVLVRWNPNTYDKRFTGGSIAPKECTQADDNRQEEARKFEIPPYDFRYTSAYTSLGMDFSLNVKDDILNITTGPKPVEDMWNDIIEKYKEDGLEEIVKKVNDIVN